MTLPMLEGFQKEKGRKFVVSLKMNPNLSAMAPHSLPRALRGGFHHSLAPPALPHPPHQGPIHPWAIKNSKEVTQVSGYSNHATGWMALPH